MTTKYELLASRSRFCVLVSYFLFLLIITLGTLVWPSCERNPNAVVGYSNCHITVVFTGGA